MLDKVALDLDITELQDQEQPIRTLRSHFGIFAFLYPRMAAGPIIRFQNIVPQVAAMPMPKREDIEFGIRRVAFGFFKKFKSSS